MDSARLPGVPRGSSAALLGGAGRAGGGGKAGIGCAVEWPAPGLRGDSALVSLDRSVLRALRAAGLAEDAATVARVAPGILRGAGRRASGLVATGRLGLLDLAAVFLPAITTLLSAASS